MTVRPVSWACGHETEMLLILKKHFLTCFLGIFRYDSPKKCPTILYAVNLWLKPATGATPPPVDDLVPASLQWPQAHMEHWSDGGPMMAHQPRRWPGTRSCLDRRLFYAWPWDEGGGGGSSNGIRTPPPPTHTHVHLQRAIDNVGRPGQPHSGLAIPKKQTNKQTIKQTNKQTSKQPSYSSHLIFWFYLS